MPVLAAIAYYSKDLLNLGEGDELVCDASDPTIASGATSGPMLLSLYRKGVKLYNQPNLHAKLACVGRHVIIGSANSSDNSQNSLIEAAVLSQDSALRAQAMALVRTMTTEQQLLSETEVNRLAEIKVSQKFSKKPKRPPIDIASKSVAWWLGTGPLSAYAEKLQEPQRKSGLRTINKINKNLKNEDIETISWPMSARVAKIAKPGDRVVQVFAKPRGNELDCILHAPAAIVHVERSEETAIIFLHKLQGKNKTVTLDKVRIAVKKIKGTMLKAASARELSESEFSMIERLY